MSNSGTSARPGSPILLLGILLLTLSSCDSGTPTSGGTDPEKTVEGTEGEGSKGAAPSGSTPQKNSFPAFVTSKGQKWPVMNGAAKGYVPDAACSSCHAAIAESYSEVGMANAIYRPDPANMMEDLENNHYFHELSKRHYELRVEKEKVLAVRYCVDEEGDRFAENVQEIDWIIGSGNHARNYFFMTDVGELYQHPLTWYTYQSGEWGMSPGYDEYDHKGLSREIKNECLFCHSAYYELPEGMDFQFKPSHLPDNFQHGLGCQRCHGPGASHIEVAEKENSSLREIRDTIVNPADLSPELQADVCNQCHLQPSSSAETILRVIGRGTMSYIPGQPLDEYIHHMDYGTEEERSERFEINHHPYRMRLSKCFTESDGKMTCTSCHDPHRKVPVEKREEYYREKCFECHDSEACNVDAMRANHDNLPDTEDCVTCHMPMRRPDDVPLTVMTDHLIRKDPAPAEWLQRKKKVVHHNTTGSFFYFPERRPPGPMADFYEATSDIRFGAVRDAIPRYMRLMETLKIDDPLAYFNYGSGVVKVPGEPSLRKALQIYEEALMKYPDYSAAWTNAAAVYGKLGMLDQAIERNERALEITPHDAKTHQNFGMILGKRKEWEPAVHHLKEAIRLNPVLPNANRKLAEVYMSMQKNDLAIEQHEKAISLNPLDHLAYIELAEIYRWKKEDEKRRKVLKQGLYMMPENAGLHRALAHAYADTRPLSVEVLQLAQETAEKAVELDPGDTQAWGHLPVYYLMGSQPRKALDRLEKAREAGAYPFFCTMVEALARLKIGEKEKALKLYAQAQAMQDRPTFDPMYAFLINYAKTLFARSQ